MIKSLYCNESSERRCTGDAVLMLLVGDVEVRHERDLTTPI